jgi:hypothetical protein
MNIGRIAFMGLALFGSNIHSAEELELKPSWTIKLDDPYFRNRVVSELPEMNRSCGVLRWDETHVLIYFMTATKHLALRGPLETQVGGWSFSVLIVRTNDGDVEKSASIPADSFVSELALVAGGIVVSNRDRLTFYSRDFIQISPSFTYAPLHPPLPTLHGPMSDPQHIYVADDQKSFLLVDSSGLKSHFFLFKGATFTERRDWMLSGVDPQSVSIKEEKIIYGKLIAGDRIASATSWTAIDDGSGTPQVFSAGSDDMLCRIPIQIEIETFLDTCGAVRIVKEKGSEIVYQPHKREVVGTLIRISPEGHLAAILKYSHHGGGVLDLNERRSHAEMLIVGLNAAHRVCEIPLLPIPYSQLAFQFGEESTLIVLNDGVVTAYKGLCLN